MGELRKIAMFRVRPSSIAMRTVNRESEAYLGLVASIRKNKFIGAISVRERKSEGETYYEIVDGLHRFQACKDAGESWINADVLDLSDDQILEHQIMASVHKVETKMCEYALQLKRILGRNPLMTMTELSLKLGKSTTWLSTRLSLNKIRNNHIKKLIDNGKISLTNAYAMAKIPVDEQINWIDRAMCQRPQDFVPSVNDRVKEIRRAARREAMERESQVHDEISLTFPNKAVVPLTGDASKIKDEIARMKVFMDNKLGTGAMNEMDDAAIAIALNSNGISGRLTRQEWQRKIEGAMLPPSGFELLHGKPKNEIEYSEIRVTTEIEEKQPLTRKGWDHVHGKSYRNAFAYCSGPWLVLFTGKHWTINHQEKPRVSNMNFGHPTEAMDFIEENFCGR